VIQEHLVEDGEPARPASHVHFRTYAQYEETVQRNGLQITHFGSYWVPNGNQKKDVFVLQLQQPS
jgi:hypothetical protein